MRRAPLVRSLALAAVLALTPGCAALSWIVQPPRYDAATTPSGVEMQDLIVPEKGRVAREGDEVTIDFIAWTGAGRRFDSTYDRGLPITFELGSGAVMAGLAEGLRGMRVGGRRSIVVPPELAFGDEGVPGEIPPRAVILFDATLVKVTRPGDEPVEPMSGQELDDADEPAEADDGAVEPR